MKFLNKILYTLAFVFTLSLYVVASPFYMLLGDLKFKEMILNVAVLTFCWYSLVFKEE